MLEAKVVLAHVTEEVVKEILAENGSPCFETTIDGKTGQKCLWFKTICHGGDSHKLCYFTESKDFYCYTNCGRMPFFNFIKKIKNIEDKNFGQAVLYVANKMHMRDNHRRIGFQDIYSETIAEDLESMQRKVDMNKTKNAKSKALSQTYSKIYDNKILEYFEDNIFYQGWIDDGITEKSMQKYGIRWYEFQKHIIIPHLNINGDLIGIRRRSLNPQDAKNKYMPEYIDGQLYDHSLSTNLYGLYYNKKAIQATHSALIVEGEKSVLLSDGYYGDNSIAVATCGFNISDIQISLLLTLGVTTVYLGFDKDFDIKQKEKYRTQQKMWQGYQHYIHRLKNICKTLSNYFHVYLLIDRENLLDIKDSPLDKGKDIYEQIKKKGIPMSVYFN